MRKAKRRVQTQQDDWQPTRQAWCRFLWLGVMATFLWAVKYHPFLASPRVIDDDARQHVYWTYRFQDNTLFRHDPLTALFASPKVAPTGYQALYALGARVMDPLLFSQVLSLGLLFLCLWLFLRITQHLGCPHGSGFASCLFLIYLLYSSSGGLPKSFAFPLLLGGIYALLRSTFSGMAALLVVQSLLYPPILFNTMALAAVMWWRGWWYRTDVHAWRHLVVLGVGTALAAGVLLSVYVFAPRPALGKMITRSEAMVMPEFGPHGRTAFYSATVWQTLRNDRAGIGADRLCGFVIIIVVMYGLGYPQRLVVPEIVRHMVWTSALLFGLAHAVLFTLHLPSRYVLYTLLLSALLVIAANSRAATTALAKRLPAGVQALQWLRHRPGAWWCSLGMAACLFAYVQNRYIVYVDPLTVRVDTVARQLYDYLQTLPKDALIAGHPLEMDNVPLFARRQVLANQELSVPYYTGYYTEVRQRLLDSLAAYYADDPQQVKDFAQRYSVDYMVLHRQHFEPSFIKGRIYYEPFDSLIKQRLAGQRHFALLEGEVGERVYVQGPYIVVSLIGVQKG